MCRLIVARLLDQRVSLVAEQFQIGQAIFYADRENVGSDTIADYEVFVPYINQLAILRSDPAGPSSELLLLGKVGRQLVRYSRVIVDVFLLWVIERKDMIRGHAGPQIQPSFKL